jgi:3-oxoacyl-[acyl-carrier-protein] synthase III
MGDHSVNPAFPTVADNRSEIRMTASGPTSVPGPALDALERSPLGQVPRGASGTTEWLWRELALVWADFEGRLEALPVVRRIHDGTITVQQYRELLLTLRQEVVEGGHWIARAASSMSIDLLPVYSLLVKRAAEGRVQFGLLEQDYASLGGDPADMRRRTKNIGSEAFSSYMYHQATQPDPLHLFGALFVVEAFGEYRAARWAGGIRQALGADESQVRFLSYRRVDDYSHFDQLRSILASVVDRSLADAVVRTATVVARLYVLQLEELGPD